MTAVKHIVSDMGGVLIELDWFSQASTMLGRTVTVDELHHLWVNASSVAAFETGQQTDFEGFIQAFATEFGYDLNTDNVATLKQRFQRMLKAPLPDCDRVLAELSQHYPLSLLSNTNPVHMQYVRSNFGSLLTYFGNLFLSFEMGYLKPNEAIYQQVVNALQLEPAAIAFFDDGRHNVEVARGLGIQAFQVQSPREILAIVQGLPK
ncbi:MAG: HAD-IA family hydrolase [Cyanobacteria bacterium P01_H01_bin.121]